MSDVREEVHVPSHHVFTMGPGPYRHLALGLQTAVVLARSLGIERGDQLVIRERHPERGCTGAWLCRKVTHIDPGTDEAGPHLFWTGGIDERFALYSLNTPAENSWAKDALTLRLVQAERAGKTKDEFWATLARKEDARRGVLRPLSLFAVGARAT